MDAQLSALAAQVEALHRRFDEISATPQPLPHNSWECPQQRTFGHHLNYQAQARPTPSIGFPTEPPSLSKLEAILTKYLHVNEDRLKGHEDRLDSIENTLRGVEATLKNHSASIRNIENQLGQIARQLAEESVSTILSNVEPPPLEHVVMITSSGDLEVKQSERHKEDFIEKGHLEDEEEVDMNCIDGHCTWIQEVVQDDLLEPSMLQVVEIKEPAPMRMNREGHLHFHLPMKFERRMEKIEDDMVRGLKPSNDPPMLKLGNARPKLFPWRPKVVYHGQSLHSSPRHTLTLLLFLLSQGTSVFMGSSYATCAREELTLFKPP